ncbi:hypothetical protein BGZ97_008393, partial [Linnemannia gamsii]
IQQLKSSNFEQDGKVIYKNYRATTLKLYQELIDAYPACRVLWPSVASYDLA